MSARKKTWIVFTLLAVAVVTKGWLVLRSYRRAGDPFAEKASIISVSSPVDLAEARKKLAMPLPDGAPNIQYARYTQFIAYEFMLKFEAPEAVCRAYAIECLQREKNRPTVGASATELRTITAPPAPIPAHPPLNVEWFDVQNIKKGSVGGQLGSHEPRVWIDSERNLFYYMCTD